MSRTALVTGGTRGIGLGIARALAAEGWDLILNGVRPAAEALAAVSGLEGVRVTYVPCDVSDLQGQEALLQAMQDLPGGSVNLLVNNAGVAPLVRADLLETSPESYDRVLGTNLRGPFFLTQAVARAMLRARHADPGFPAAIICVGSVSATTVSVNRPEYCIAKAGLGMLASLFSARLGPEGIPVYEVRPGVIRTDMTRGVGEKYDRLLSNGLCVQPRWGLPEDVGRAVASLARGDFAYSSGQVFHVDGGLHVPRL